MAARRTDVSTGLRKVLRNSVSLLHTSMEFCATSVASHLTTMQDKGDLDRAT